MTRSWLAPVGCRRVERLGGDGDRGRIADGALGVGDVVVDGLGDADEGNASTAPAGVRRMSRLPSPPTPISPSSAEPLEPGDHLARTVLLAAVGHGKGEGIAAIGAAEEGAALARQRRIEAIGIELDGFDRPLQQAERARAQPHRRPAVAMMRAQRHGADGGVEAAAIAAAGQDADSLGHAPPPHGLGIGVDDLRGPRAWRAPLYCSNDALHAKETTDLRHQTVAAARLPRR